MSWFDDDVGARTADEPFLAALRTAIERWPAPAEPGRFVVAFSGGLDSTVLLTALVRLAGRERVGATHVDHGLHPSSGAWASHCAAYCATLGVAIRMRRVPVARASGRGLEAAAREARYRALEALLEPGEMAVTAHHADDQLETVLLRLLRGAGVRGMRGIAAFGPFGRGALGRPLLGLRRAAIEAQAREWRLEWLEDPANADLHHDRNFLRHAVVPLLARRWPQASSSAGRLAAQMADAEELLGDAAAADAAALEDARRVPRAALAALSPARRRNLLRHLLRAAGFAPPSARKIDELCGALLGARPGANPLVRWPGGEARVFRDRLYLLAPLPSRSAPALCVRLDARGRWAGPEGEIGFEPVATGPGLPRSWLDQGLYLRFRAGGERFQPADKRHSQPLKDWLREAAIVPWMRDRIPLIYRADRLVAVGDLWIGAEAAAADPAEPRFRVEWTGHAPLN